MCELSPIYHVNAPKCMTGVTEVVITRTFTYAVLLFKYLIKVVQINYCICKFKRQRTPVGTPVPYVEH